MKTNFNKKTILGIVLQVRKYGKLFVATDGSMFRSAQSAESTLRTKNMIIGDPTLYLGFVEITKEMVSDDKLKLYATDTTKFDALFNDAKVPLMRTIEAPKGRKHAEKSAVNPNEVSELKSLLGMVDEPDAENEVSEADETSEADEE